MSYNGQLERKQGHFVPVTECCDAKGTLRSIGTGKDYTCENCGQAAALYPKYVPSEYENALEQRVADLEGQLKKLLGLLEIRL